MIKNKEQNIGKIVVYPVVAALVIINIYYLPKWQKEIRSEQQKNNEQLKTVNTAKIYELKEKYEKLLVDKEIKEESIKEKENISFIIQDKKVVFEDFGKNIAWSLFPSYIYNIKKNIAQKTFENLGSIEQREKVIGNIDKENKKKNFLPGLKTDAINLDDKEECANRWKELTYLQEILEGVLPNAEKKFLEKQKNIKYALYQIKEIESVSKKLYLKNDDVEDKELQIADILNIYIVKLTVVAEYMLIPYILSELSLTNNLYQLQSLEIEFYGVEEKEKNIAKIDLELRVYVYG